MNNCTTVNSVSGIVTIKISRQKESLRTSGKNYSDILSISLAHFEDNEIKTELKS